MDILRRLHAAANDDLQRAEKRLSEIVSMLTGLVKGLDGYDRKDEVGQGHGRGQRQGRALNTYGFSNPGGAHRLWTSSLKGCVQGDTGIVLLSDSFLGTGTHIANQSRRSRHCIPLLLTDHYLTAYICQGSKLCVLMCRGVRYPLHTHLA